MKKLLFIIPLAISVTTMGCANNSDKETAESGSIEQSSDQQPETIKEDVDVNQFAALVEKGDGQVLDVRTPEEWAEGTIKDAIKINFYDDDFNAQIEKLDKSKPVYVYCKAGGRSAQAASQLHNSGFNKVYNLLGGMGAWNGAGKEVVK